MKTLEFESSPDLLKPYIRSVVGKRPGLRRAEDLPGIRAQWHGIKIDREHLRRYEDLVVSHEPGVPLHYPHVLAGGVHLAMLTSPEFPVRLLGCVHVRNHTIRYRTIDPGEVLDMTAEMMSCSPNPKGITFDLDTKFRVNGELVWAERTTFLARQKSDAKKSDDPTTALFDWDDQTMSVDGSFDVLPGTGRTYAAVSKDYNPIHLTPVTARAFGFKRDIIHGMWTAARVLAFCPAHAGEGPLRVDVAFKGPLYMGATAEVRTSLVGDALALHVHDCKALKKGDLRPLFQMRVSAASESDLPDFW